MKIFFLAALIAFAGAGHWEHWMVFRKDCGTVEKRCVADSLNEINPSCESSQENCKDELQTFTRGGHWEEWMVYRRDCGTIEKRCMADSPNEISPICKAVEKPGSVHVSWEDAIAKTSNTINLKIGEETKKVPVMISMDGTKYLIFQRRLNGEVDFYRNWNDYVNGFGNPEGDYWIGLKALNILTSTDKFAMTVFLQTFNNTQAYAHYGTFQIGGPETNYKLSVGGYSGTAGDGLIQHNNMMFSTYDHGITSCAVTYRGAWWYKACHQSNLNGIYYGAPGNHTQFANGVNWLLFMNPHVSMKIATMALSLK